MIWIILIISLVLRLITINQSLWLDEADNVVAAQIFDFISFVTRYTVGDYHPPGYFALLWVWSHIFGFSEIAVRIPSVFLGIGTVFLTYLLGKQLFDKEIALLASFFLAIAPLHIYYSQEARMYSLAAFGAALSFYFLTRLVEVKRWAILGYTLGVILVLYSDYVAYLILPSHLIYLLLGKTRIWKKLLTCWSLALVAFLPWLITIFPQQFIEGKEAAVNLPIWKKVAGGTDFKNIALIFTKAVFGRISFENKLFYGFAAALMGVLYGWVIVRGIKKIDHSTKLILAWLFIPILLAILVSGYIPILSYFRMIFILPAFYLLAAKGALGLPPFIAKPVLGMLIAVSIGSLGAYYLNPKFQREDWRGAANFLKHKLDEKSAVLFEDNHIKFPYVYYQKNLTNTYPGLRKIQAKTIDDVENLEVILAEKNRAYVFEYLVEITDPSRLLEKKIKQLGFTQKDVYNFNGVGFVRLYQR